MCLFCFQLRFTRYRVHENTCQARSASCDKIKLERSLTKLSRKWKCEICLASQCRLFTHLEKFLDPGGLEWCLPRPPNLFSALRNKVKRETVSCRLSTHGPLVLPIYIKIGSFVFFLNIVFASSVPNERMKGRTADSEHNTSSSSSSSSSACLCSWA